MYNLRAQIYLKSINQKVILLNGHFRPSGGLMSRRAMTIYSPEGAPILVWDGVLGAEDGKILDGAVDFRRIQAASDEKIQFAPHRLVGNYAEYRKLRA
jgi:hypothetical protein